MCQGPMRAVKRPSWACAAGRLSPPTRPLMRPPPLPPAYLQLPLLKARWKQVLFGAIFQYVHGIFTQLAHRMHRPQAEPLHDIGFAYLPVWGAGDGCRSATQLLERPRLAKVPQGASLYLSGT